MVTKTLILKKSEKITEVRLADVYMILVDGKGEPRKHHFDVIAATKEAKRLAEKEAPKLVSLMKVLCCWQGKVKVEDAELPQPPAATE